jgi:hypothetical protein
VPLILEERGLDIEATSDAHGMLAIYLASEKPDRFVSVELKQPGRRDASRDDVVSKTLDYTNKLKSGRATTEGGAVIDVEPNALTTVYVLADWTADFKEYLDREEFTTMPGDVGSSNIDRNRTSCSLQCPLSDFLKVPAAAIASFSRNSA